MAGYAYRSLAERQRIQAMVEAGKTAKDISAEMGLSLSAVYSELKRGRDGRAILLFRRSVQNRSVLSVPRPLTLAASGRSRPFRGVSSFDRTRCAGLRSNFCAARWRNARFLLPAGKIGRAHV